MHEHPRKTIVLSDGGLPALVALAHAREAMILAGAGVAEHTPPRATDHEAGPSPMLAVLPCGVSHGSHGIAKCPRIGAVLAQAAGLALPPPLDAALLAARPQAEAPQLEREAVELVAASCLAARLGYERVVWASHAGGLDAIDIDRLTHMLDVARLASRLATLAVPGASPAGVTIEVPFADLTDRQVADLAVDIAAPVQTCWWWAGTDEASARERARWDVAFEHAGWNLRGEGAGSGR